MIEIWKDIEGFEGLYRVSSLGNFMSLKRKRVIEDTLLHPYKDKNGYLIIDFRKNNKRYTFKAHRLVAKHFVPNPYNKGEVNHIDATKNNNFYQNLEWCTHLENVTHAVRSGLLSNRKNIRYEWSLTIQQIQKIKKLLALGALKQIEIAEIYNVSQGTISLIKRGKKTW